MLTIREAMDAFIAGWAFSRAVERKVTVSHFHGLRRVQFGNTPVLKSRPDEFMILDVPPDEVIRLLRPTVADIPHRLSVFTDQPEDSLDDYARHNYHLFMQEYLMAVDLTASNFSTAEGVPVERVASEEARAWFNYMRQREVIPPHTLNDNRMGCYYIRFGDDLACEGRCIFTPENVAVMDMIYTTEEYRRQGLGSALMLKMLVDAAERSAAYSALAASVEGRKLYLTLGYQVLSDMLILEPD
jgi:GNAT superfamily N-acetyltransferase